MPRISCFFSVPLEYFVRTRLFGHGFAQQLGFPTYGHEPLAMSSSVLQGAIARSFCSGSVSALVRVCDPERSVFKYLT